MSTETIQETRQHRGFTPHLTLAAGGLFVAVPLLVEFVSGDLFALMGLAGLLLVAALPGLRRLQGGADGRSGTWGLRLTTIGCGSLAALIISGDLIDAVVNGVAQDVTETVFTIVAALAGLATLVGIVLFSVGMIRARVFPPAATWLFLGSMVVAFLSESFEQSLRGPVPWLADVLPPLGFIVAGLGLLVIGRSALNRTAPDDLT